MCYDLPHVCYPPVLNASEAAKYYSDDETRLVAAIDFWSVQALLLSGQCQPGEPWAGLFTGLPLHVEAVSPKLVRACNFASKQTEHLREAAKILGWCAHPPVSRFPQPIYLDYIYNLAIALP